MFLLLTNVPETIIAGYDYPDSPRKGYYGSKGYDYYPVTKGYGSKGYYKGGGYSKGEQIQLGPFYELYRRQFVWCHAAAATTSSGQWAGSAKKAWLSRRLSSALGKDLHGCPEGLR
jgi:hypothetical protein